LRDAVANAFSVPSAFLPKPGLKQPWVKTQETASTLKRGWRTLRDAVANAFSVSLFFLLNPGLKQPWAEIGQRLRRYSVGFA
jgi:hypothetical protein